jgi:phosphoenolpyruvate carboxykinase (ATP)
MIAAALSGELKTVEFITDHTFGLSMPKECPGVPSELLNPENSWADAYQYQLTAKKLAHLFIENFKLYKNFATPAILDGGPKIKSVYDIPSLT